MTISSRPLPSTLLDSPNHPVRHGYHADYLEPRIAVLQSPQFRRDPFDSSLGSREETRRVGRLGHGPGLIGVEFGGERDLRHGAPDGGRD